MVLISKVTTALASATSEFTPAAANFNVDFSLFKFEALNTDAKENAL